MERRGSFMKLLLAVAALAVLVIGGLVALHHAHSERESVATASPHAGPVITRRSIAPPRMAPVASAPAAALAPAPAPDVPKMAPMTLGSPQSGPVRVSARQIVAKVSSVRVRQQQAKPRTVAAAADKPEGQNEGVVYGNWLGPGGKMPVGGSGD
jgi:hypothetical protein